MGLFLKLENLKGESTDAGHKDWINVETMATAIHRSIQNGAKDQQRIRGDTTLQDITVTRTTDTSSVKLQEACANGTYFKEAEIDVTSPIGRAGENDKTILKYKLYDVILTSYTIQTQSGNAMHETLSMNFSKVEWTYSHYDSKTTQKKGDVMAKYEPGPGKS